MRKILLVEGPSDQEFFKKLINTIYPHHEINVVVCTPRDLNPSDHNTYNTKEGVFNSLYTHLKSLGDDKYEQIAIVVDADRDSDGKGYKKTKARINNKLGNEYKLFPNPEYDLNHNGLIYKHIHDSSPRFGAWIMPNNSNDGTLEDWIISCINKSEDKIFTHVKNTITQLEPDLRKFKPLYQSKAEIATWLAWQKKPGQQFESIFKDELIDTKNEKFLQFTQWLSTIFELTPKP
jgi:hypothetical protein